MDIDKTVLYFIYCINNTGKVTAMKFENEPSTDNKYVLDWIGEMAELTRPDKILWITGDPEQTDELRRQACSTGEMIKLNEELLPGCYLHRTAVNDVARVEARTFICTRKKEDAGNINNWIEPQECYARLTKLFRNSYAGRTMA